ncbi:MAG: hypothetical protein IPK50_11505 [Fibrobacterota bacterium]|nr:hypothetical protein [Fibrobacterota bacterium]QQS07499.1 MAG: hypothetical protein IPK50_11505 [Fibrobacterota bacterium]
MKFSLVRAVAIVCIALPTFLACKPYKSKPKPKVNASGWHRPEEPNHELFEQFQDPNLIWPIFLKMIDTARTDEELVSVFASAANSGYGSLRLWDSASGVRWRKEAMATKDLKKRELYRIWGATSTHDGMQNFYQYAFEMPPGTHVPFHADSSQVRLQRTRMRLSADLSMEATDLVDTITIDEKQHHEFFSSKPMERGLWRLTALDVSGFREWFLNVDDLPVHVADDADGFQVWVGAGSRIHVRSDSVWKKFSVAPDSVLRISMLPDSLHERKIGLVIESEGHFAFREIHVPRRDRDRWVRSAYWTEQDAYAPGERVRIHGVLRVMGRDGRLSLPELPAKLQVLVSEVPTEVKPDREGHFRLAYATDPKVGKNWFRLGVAVPTEWVIPPRPNDSRREPWWHTPAGRWRTDFTVRDGKPIENFGSESTEPRSYPQLGAHFDKLVYRQGERAQLFVWMEDSTGMIANDEVEVQFRRATGLSKFKVRLDRGMGEAWIPMDVADPIAVSLHADRVKPLGWGIDGDAFANVVAADSSHPPREAHLSIETKIDNLLPGSMLKVRVTSLHDGAPVLLETRGARLGPTRSGWIRNGAFEAEMPVEDLGGRWRLSAHLRTSAGIRSVASRVSLADDRLAQVAVSVSKSGKIRLRVSDIVGRALRANLTVSVTSNPSSAPGLDSLARMDSLPDGPSVWPVFQAKFLLPWKVGGAKLSSDQWFPRSSREEDRPAAWPRKIVRYPAERRQVTDPEDPEGVNFDPSLRLEEIFAGLQSYLHQSPLRGKPLPVAYWNEGLHTGFDGAATFSVDALPPGVWWVVVRGTAEGGRVVNKMVRI